MSVGEDEAITRGPLRDGRVIVHHLWKTKCQGLMDVDGMVASCWFGSKYSGTNLVDSFDSRVVDFEIRLENHVLRKPG